MKKIYIGKKKYIFNEISSTMDIANFFIHTGIEEGTVVVAKFQTDGRGSNQRKWLSNGNDALFSIIMKPEISLMSTLPIISAFSIYKVLEKFIDTEIKIKWPNDVLVDGKKISGVLVENHIKSDNYSIIGIGININSDHKKNNTFIYPSVSLMELLNEKIQPLEIVEDVLKSFENIYNEILIGKLKISNLSDKLYGLNKRVAFRTNYKSFDRQSENAYYKIISLNDDGTLEVLDKNGKKISINASEIIT
ncbi:MAG: biotin--[acetyl-CoA-carboxylase] ligase [Dehalococcoidia bacterium]|nr:biotin--[acetyl-CoA-carboxylase] ligase [Dehalococcoidia bacterium]